MYSRSDQESQRQNRHESFGVFLDEAWLRISRRRMRCMLFWPSIPAGRDYMCGTRQKGPRPPSPDPTGGRCTVQLFPALALPDQGVNTPSPTSLQAHLRLRCAGPAGLRASPTYIHLSVSADWPVKRRSPLASHPVAALSRRHWFQRLSVKLVAHVLAQVRHCDIVPGGLATRGPANTITNHHTHYTRNTSRHAKRENDDRVLYAGGVRPCPTP